jgi:putative N-acetyltransferase (TIGR04045 family)
MTSSWTPVASGVTLAVACAADELEAHFAVRHRIFVSEQHLFAGTDRDSHDDEPDTVHVIASVDGEVVGAVRLYPLHGDVWKGDRLAVVSHARVHQLGGQLVRFAVRTAGERGGSRMVAQVQVPNVRFFERLGWSRDGAAAPYVGVMHQPMEIPLQPPTR